MIEKDTVRLLRECDAGVKMGISAIDGVIEYVESEKLKRTLAECRREHKVLEKELKEELERLGEKSKEPNPVAEGMSKMKTAAKFAFGGDDSTAATLMPITNNIEHFFMCLLGTCISSLEKSLFRSFAQF